MDSASSLPSRTKKTKTTMSATSSIDSDIDANVCCMCFVRYEEDVIGETGAVWVSCTCGRWLHENCAEDCVRKRSYMYLLFGQSFMTIFTFIFSYDT